MAGAVVPLITALAPTVLELITSLVHQFAPQAEAAYGPKTGPVKFADVFGQVVTKLQAAAALGQIPKELPSEEALKTIIQITVTSMQLLGLIDKAAIADAGTAAAPSAKPTPAAPVVTVNPTGAQVVKLAPGQQLLITAA